MPTIFDNIDEKLLPILQKSLQVAYRADFCIGYFNLNGWKHLANDVDNFKGGENNCCRILIGMTQTAIPDWRIRYALKTEETPDPKTMMKRKNAITEEFHQQLTRHLPSNQNETYLKQLVTQLKTEKVKIKLFLEHPLHAKLYLLHRNDTFNPLISYLGSSNLTYAGLSKQGELNVDIETKEAGEKLIAWFEERWENRRCIDISQSLIEVIEQSWIEQRVTPYEVYLKIAYHLSQEARISLNEFAIPREFRKKLFAYQTTAVKLAARHLEKRGGVLLADVVGLGKTLMATVLAKIFEDVHRLETLIICPKNLVSMWKTGYCDPYLKMATVLSITEVIKELVDLKRYHLVIIDESHNLRNREGKRYKAIREYLIQNESKVILLSATPYNKSYQDLASQLRLFIPENKNLGIRPETLLSSATKDQQEELKNCSPFSLAAFEISPHTEDWRELMRHYMVRRTRSFIQENYTTLDPDIQRHYLLFDDNTRAYFPKRRPKTLKLPFSAKTPYAFLYAQSSVDLLSQLHLPRYGLGNEAYLRPSFNMSAEDENIIKDLNRGGKRLMGFCRTNLFKRLESSEISFLYSLERHILRNYVTLYALENSQPVPLGAQQIEVSRFDTQLTDNDEDILQKPSSDIETEESTVTESPKKWAITTLQNRAADLYQSYRQTKSRFRWLAADYFSPLLTEHLQEDSSQLLSLLQRCEQWNSQYDIKLSMLLKVITELHPQEKILVFTQFADTALYLEHSLTERGIEQVAAVTGQTENPSEFITRFSPVSNGSKTPTDTEKLRVLIATDVLSEGQNLQDAAIVVNYDLPWAIIRLIQRVGRVDRIGQQAEEILCYSFLPEEGVESLINLRERLRLRLHENAELIGTDEAFFEDDKQSSFLSHLYHEKADILEDEADTEVDLISEAYAVWTKAIKENPALKNRIPQLPAHIHTTKSLRTTAQNPEGVIVYLTTPNGSDNLAWINSVGQIITDSPSMIFRSSACAPNTPSLPRQENHFELVKQTIQELMKNDQWSSTGTGRPNSTKARVYEQLKLMAQHQGTLLEYPMLNDILEQLSDYPLYPTTLDELHYKVRNRIENDELMQYVIQRYREQRLCIVYENTELHEPQVICSLGIRSA